MNSKFKLTSRRKIDIKNINKKSNIEDKRLADIMEPKIIKEKHIPVKRALLIGINYIGTDNELNGCINDVKNMSDLLIKSFNYDISNIQILSDDQPEEFKPTRINILTFIEKFTKLTESGDELFIHYSGHGSQVADINNDEFANKDAKGQDDCICPCNFGSYAGTNGFIIDDELKDILVNAIPVGAKLRAFFDCCHSGSCLDLPYMYTKNEKFVKIESKNKKSADCLLISGCRDQQTSADAFIGKNYSGALTYALIKALTAAVSVKTTWKDLFLVVRHILVAEGYDQVPMLSVGSRKVSYSEVDL
jgi:hypothetical protein